MVDARERGREEHDDGSDDVPEVPLPAKQLYVQKEGAYYDGPLNQDKDGEVDSALITAPNGVFLEHGDGWEQEVDVPLGEVQDQRVIDQWEGAHQDYHSVYEQEELTVVEQAGWVSGVYPS